MERSVNHNGWLEEMKSQPILDKESVKSDFHQELERVKEENQNLRLKLEKNQKVNDSGKN